MRKLFARAAALLFLASAAFAQTSTGNIYGTVTDESGAVLPGRERDLDQRLHGRPHHHHAGPRGTSGS